MHYNIVTRDISTAITLLDDLLWFLQEISPLNMAGDMIERVINPLVSMVKGKNEIR